MASQGPLYPSTATSVVSGDANEVAWTNPGNVVSDNATEAQITAATFDSPDPSQWLYARGFGFTIPAGATIDGIVVEVDRRSIIANSGVDKLVHLANAVGVITGTDHHSATVWPTTSTVQTYGTSSDTWGASPTQAMVNDPDFGVYFQARANIANADIGVDFIRMTVYYTAPADADAEVAWAELEVPTANADAEVAWAEFEVPTAPADAEVAWAEFEVPNAPADAEIAWAELEVPDVLSDAAAEVSFSELEVPSLVDASAEVAWAELEVPSLDADAEIAWAEVEVQDAPAAAEVSWAELEVPTADSRADVAWAELEVPTADAWSEVSFSEMELPDADANAEVSWAELEVPDFGAPTEHAESIRTQPTYERRPESVDRLREW